MRISPQGKIRQIKECYAAPIAVDFTAQHITADDLRGLHIQQMRRMERLIGSEQSICQ